jgi:hypothetical protein
MKEKEMEELKKCVMHELSFQILGSPEKKHSSRTNQDYYLVSLYRDGTGVFKAFASHNDVEKMHEVAMIVNARGAVNFTIITPKEKEEPKKTLTEAEAL